MKPQLGRLLKRAEFLRVARAGRKWVTGGLILQALERPSGEASGSDRQGPAPLRYGLTASRKVGNAVTRNRARRRLRALSQEILPQRGRPGTDYVLIARRETPTRAYRSLVADLESALERIESAGRQGRRPRRPAGRPGPRS